MSNEADEQVEENILQEADRIIHGARNKDYGHPLDNHSSTAAMWSSYLTRITGEEILISPKDVCILNILQKVSRGANSMTRDTIVDIAGYAGNIEMIDTEMAERLSKLATQRNA